jgi:perosamine synthetase
MSLMSGKSLATGEAGMVVTDDREIYERSIAYGHYERYTLANIETEDLKPYVGLPLGGQKLRMHQLSSAMGRVQLKYYDERMAQDPRSDELLLGSLWKEFRVCVPIECPKDSDSTMAGWYAAKGLYVPEELEGLSVTQFSQAVRAEGDGLYTGRLQAIALSSDLQHM